MTTTTNSPSFGEIGIDLERLMATRMLIQAGSGGGKSWVLRRLVEQTAPHVQQFIIDPEGEFVSLREKFDHVICAARGGDILIQPFAAKKLARALWKSGCSAVLDISELNVPDRVVFVSGFLDALIQAPREAWHPAMVVVDEAATFAPQQGGIASAKAMIDMATRGRKRGLAMICAVQRISRLNKDIAAELGNRLIGRTTLDVDIARAADEMGMRKADATERLRALRPGQFYAFGPALTPFVTLTTIGPVETTHHQAATGARIPVRPAVLEKIAHIEGVQIAVEEEDQTVESLQVKIRRLEQAGGGGPTQDDYDAVCRARDQNQERADEAESQLIIQREEVAAIADEVTDALRPFTTLGMLNARLKNLPPVTITGPDGGKVAVAKPGVFAYHEPVSRRAHVAALAPRETVSMGYEHPGVTKPQQRILDALIKLDVLGIPSPKKHVLAMFAGASSKSSAYSNNLGALRTAGLIQYLNGGVRLTEQGMELANAPKVISIRDEWLQLLTEPQRRIMEVLLGEYPNPLHKVTLAERAGASATSSAFSNNLGWMRTLGILDYPSQGQVAATDLIKKGKS